MPNFDNNTSMPIFETINRLRKNGRLHEAYDIALKAIEKYPENIWIQRAMGWVYYEYLKRCCEQNNFEKIVTCIQKIKGLEVINSAEDSVFRKCICNELEDYTQAAANKQRNNYYKMQHMYNQLYEELKEIHFTKPGEDYNAYFNVFRSSAEIWPNFIQFCDEWDFTNLRPEDYKQRISQKTKKTYMGFAECAYIAYSKALLVTKDVEKIKEFEPKLENIAEKYPTMSYPGYFCGKLLLAVDADDAQMLHNIIPFVCKKRRDFWAWQMLAEVFDNDFTKKIACLLRATRCTDKNEFLVKVFISLAQAYADQNNYGRAKFYLDKANYTYLKNGWHQPTNLQQLAKMDWANTVQADNTITIDFMTITNEILGIEPKSKKVICGKVVQNKAKTALFVNSNETFAYLPATLAKSSDIHEEDFVQATIQENFDNKHNKKSWICISIKKQDK